MEIAYHAPLPPWRQLTPGTSPSPSTDMATRPEGALAKQAKRVPAEQGLEGELLKGRAQAPAGGEGLRGYTYRGEYRPEGATPGRRAVSVYLYHARLTFQSTAHSVDVYA